MAAQAGLTLLKAREKHQAIFLWGKILGKESDYYIAYGLRDSKMEFPSKCWYYSGEDFEFSALPGLTEEVGEHIASLGLVGAVTGNPSATIEPSAYEGAENEAPVAFQGPKLTELERLALLVQEIDFDTAVVPKGAFALNEAQAVVPSSAFQGLESSKATHLESYVHFRPPASVASLKAYAQSDAHFYANFLDSLGGDLPKGCWAIRQDPSGAGPVSLRSLSWPGYVAFHVPGTSKFGGLYCGHALKNNDLPFII
ncbi:unnamed protein product [Polarella glacialis]|uniref:Radial spoke head protein 9 homolog n=2 Tax=Polarella glacialis TaxID=89957 RepID=A0A813KRC2_POLGL|nr:unnamed protein product [Polarella glacialis]